MKKAICPFCGKKAERFIMFHGDVVGCQYCGINTKETNADRIRAMTDEELANFLMDVACRGGIETENGIARWTLIDWLKQECET